jgi:hypothetical protein
MGFVVLHPSCVTVWETLLSEEGQTKTYEGRLFVCHPSFLKTENVNYESSAIP